MHTTKVELKMICHMCELNFIIVCFSASQLHFWFDYDYFCYDVLVTFEFVADCE